MKKFFSLMFAVFLCFLAMLFFDIGMNFTPSLPKGFYIKNNEEIAYNSIVKFCLPTEIADKTNGSSYLSNGICENGLKPLLKNVIGMTGDEIEIKEQRIFIRKQGFEKADFLGIIQKIDSKNVPLHSLLEEGIIPPNKVYVYSSHTGSYDSRYIGLIDKNTLTHMKAFMLF